VTKDGTLAVVSDPDRDAVYVVDLGAQKVSHTIALHTGDEPGRLVEDGAGRVQVALRSGGALVTIDPESGSVIARRSVCPAPRGVAWDETTDLVWVACATGELVALPSAGGSSTRSLVLERDLRDVVISNGSLSVTNFRTAEVLRVASDGSISRRDQLPSPVSAFTPHVAWRVVGASSGAVVAVHQAETTQSLSTMVQGGYGGGACGGLGLPSGLAVPVSSGNPSVIDDAGEGVDAEASGNCFAGAPGVGVPGGPTGSGAGVGLPVSQGCGPESGAVMSVLTVLTADGTVTVNTSFAGVLPVDVAVSPDGSLVAAVAPGNSFALLSTVFEFSSCGSPVSEIPSNTLQQPIAVAFDSKDDLLVQTREPAQLSIFSSLSSGAATTISLSTTTREDTGYDVFHTQAGGMIACASCHPEGRDDGFVWTLNGDRRRTPSLRGTIAGTAPYHWPGDEPNLNVLVNDVYTVRMSGATLAQSQMGAITSWVQNVSPPPAPSWVDAASAQRGKALFENASIGCATCHSGAKFTNNLTMDVGTGGNFQVPPLVGVGWSTPLMHDGCALTLADRFGACATPQHGSTASLSQQNVSDLVAYLETL
jgi:mono/diheme cytochrome c family protein